MFVYELAVIRVQTSFPVINKTSRMCVCVCVFEGLGQRGRVMDGGRGR